MQKVLKICIIGNVEVRIVTSPEDADITISYAAEEACLKKENLEISSEAMASKLISKLGIRTDVRGYRYIMEAIKIIIAEPDIINSLTKVLYPKIAKVFNVTNDSVSRGIENAISRGWKRGNVDFQKEIFNISEKRPRPAEFLSLVAERVKFANLNIN